MFATPMRYSTLPIVQAKEWRMAIANPGGEEMAKITDLASTHAFSFAESNGINLERIRKMSKDFAQGMGF